MNFEFVFRTMQEQYERMYDFMQSMDVAMNTLKTNNTANTLKIGKTLKRVARVEDKLKIINIEEKE